MSKRGSNASEASSPHGARHEIADVDERSRIVFPASLTEGLVWLKGPEMAECLAVLDEPGAIRVVGLYAAYAESLVAKATELAARERHGDLQVLADRHRVLSVASRRATLGESLMFHLSLPLGVPAQVYVWRVGEYIEIVTRECRNARLARGAKLFGDIA